MVDARSLMLGAIVGFTGAMLGVGFWGCQKDKDAPKTTEPAPTEHTSPAPTNRVAPKPAPAAPAQSKRELETVLAKVDDVVITIGEFQERINRMSPYVRDRYTSLETKRDFLQKLIQFEVLAKEAKRRGFDKDPNVVRTLKQVMIQKLTKDEFENKVKPTDVTEAEMRAFYEKNRKMYTKEAELRVSAIIMNNFAVATRVAKEALGPVGRSPKGFRDLVGKYSIDDATKIRGGDLRYFKRTSTTIPRPIIEAAFKLNRTGDVTGPINGGNGRYYIIRQTGKRPAVNRTFEQVKRNIKNRLYREKRRDAQKEFLKRLKAKAKIKLYEHNLAKVRIDRRRRPRRSHHHGYPPDAPQTSQPNTFQ